ncbi:MAG: hypothetical protein IKD78_04565 [Bacteroidales bacterium]|nr:hypothetical protein [Bacteroidales bacterium]
MRTFIFPFKSEERQGRIAEVWRGLENNVVVLNSYPLDKETRMPTDFDFHEFVSFLFGKTDASETVNLVFDGMPTAKQFKALMKPMPCRLRIHTGNPLCGDTDEVFHHDGNRITD